MRTVYKHELKSAWKSLFIWSVCVGGMGLACILLFSNVKESMGDLAESFSSMGAFSEAFGMTQLSIATLPGFFATEVGAVHALGGSMFAAIISTVMLSKEEDGHTGEFLFSLPLGRGKIVLAKGGAVATLVLLFNLICVGLYLFGIVVLGEEMPMKEFFLFQGMQVLLHIEVAAVCYGFSAFQRRNKFGIGIGIVLLLYAYDLLARVVPDMGKGQWLTPFSYSNATDILSTGKISVGAAVFGVLVFIAGVGTAYVRYTKRDLTT